VVEEEIKLSDVEDEDAEETVDDEDDC